VFRKHQRRQRFLIEVEVVEQINAKRRLCERYGRRKQARRQAAICLRRGTSLQKGLDTNLNLNRRTLQDIVRIEYELSAAVLAVGKFE
jgi:hypothetical protein